MANVDRSKLLNKADALVELLRTHPSVFVHLDSRTPGVIVPQQHMGKPNLCLQLGLNLARPIQGFALDKNGWTAILTFGSGLFRCIVPWKAVFCIISETGFGASWPDDVPPEVTKAAEEAAAAEKQQPAASAETSVKRVLPKGWKVIEGGKTDALPLAEVRAVRPRTQKPPEPPPKRGYRKPGPFKPSA